MNKESATVTQTLSFSELATKQNPRHIPVLPLLTDSKPIYRLIQKSMVLNLIERTCREHEIVRTWKSHRLVNELNSVGGPKRVYFVRVMLSQAFIVRDTAKAPFCKLWMHTALVEKFYIRKNMPIC